MSLYTVDMFVILSAGSAARETKVQDPIRFVSRQGRGYCNRLYKRKNKINICRIRSPQGHKKINNTNAGASPKKGDGDFAKHFSPKFRCMHALHACIHCMHAYTACMHKGASRGVYFFRGAAVRGHGVAGCPSLSPFRYTGVCLCISSPAPPEA